MDSQELQALTERYRTDIAAAGDAAALEALRVRAVGRKGEITEKLKALGGMSADERREFGPKLNGLKSAVNDLLSARKSELDAADLDRRLAGETQDLTLPVRPSTLGRIHPVSQVIDELVAIFAEMDFAVAEGPDIETDWHNFTALNMPAEHPARQMHDTFYMPPGEDGQQKLLRTHTSPVQVRTMLTEKPPIRIIVPGRTYRCDYDQTHTPMFHQVEGLVIDKSTHFGHLKGTLENFCKAFFERNDVKIRFRPSYFPFTEPSAEVDIGCSHDGNELKIGEGDDWLEILGSGMVHPRVLEACGLDPTEYQGFAFGMGIDRIAMLKYGIADLRSFFDSDLRWLKHYGFVPLDMPSLAGGLTV